MPCLVCGQLSRNGSYCEAHPKPETPRRREKKRALYDTEYKKQAKLVRDTAVQCWICGGGALPNDPWQADHYYPGVKDSPLVPAHRSCNAKRGNTPPPHPAG